MINVYLDVDGVLLSFRYFAEATSRPGEWVDYEPHDGLVYKPSVVAAINALAEKPGVAMHWLTTWGDKARTELCPAIGLNGQDWDVVGERMRREPPWWKLQAIQGHYRGEDVLWIDDDIDSDLDALDWLHSLPDARWLSPDCWTGLHDYHLKIADAWTQEAA